MMWKSGCDLSSFFTVNNLDCWHDG